MPPHIASTTIYGPNGSVIASIDGQVPLIIGVRYTVGVKIDHGTFATYTAGVEVNPSLQVPASLNLLNRVAATGLVAVMEDQNRRFAFTPSEPGSFQLGFQLGNQTGGLARTLESASRAVQRAWACTAKSLRV